MNAMHADCSGRASEAARQNSECKKRLIKVENHALCVNLNTKAYGVETKERQKKEKEHRHDVDLFIAR